MLVGASDKLKQAAQYAYDTRLSKPYTLAEIDWDWGYPDNNGPIWRPNHGLAHSARGAMYAPTVIDYFKTVTGSKDYDFSPDDIEKIQIALMFRVTGRENEGGFADYKDQIPNRYAEFQKQHAQNFREYCKAHPGIYTDEEVELYATTLATYANPTANSPLAIIFKTCHNLDLLRVRNPDKLSEELAIPTQILGTENVKELMLYADNCLRMTGNQITYPNPIVGNGSAVYDDAVFRVVSTDVNECFKVIGAVPLPPPPKIIPAKEITLTKDILLHHDVVTFETVVKPLLGEKNPIWIMMEMQQLVEHSKISNEQKIIIANKCSALLSLLIKAEVPANAFKPLIEYLQNPDAILDEKSDPIVKTYGDLMNAVHTQVPGVDIGTWGAAPILAATKAQKESIEFTEKKDKLSEKPGVVILSNYIIEDDLYDGAPSESPKEFAAALTQQSTELFLNIKMQDLSSPYRDKNLSIIRFQSFADSLTEMVIQDILKAKTADHQVNIAKYYYGVMRQCYIDGDMHSSAAIFQAINNPAITRLIQLEGALTANEKRDRDQLYKLFSPNHQATYEFNIHNRNKPYIPSCTHLLKTVNRENHAVAGVYSNQLEIMHASGFAQADMLRIKSVNQSYNRFIAAQQNWLQATHRASEVDVSRVHNVVPLSDEKRKILSERIQPIQAFDSHAFVQKLNNKLLVKAGKELIKALNDDLKVPTLFSFKDKSGIYHGPDACRRFLETLDIFTQMVVKNKATLGAADKQLFEKIAIMALSIKEYVQKNKMTDPSVLKSIKDIEAITVSEGVTAVESLRTHEARFAKWKKGGQVTIQEIKTPVPAGPLPKNEYTHQYETLMKGMLAGDSYSVQILNNSSTGKDEAVITMDGVDYNLAEIMKYANLNQLTLTANDIKAYEAMVIDNTASLKHFPGTPPNNMPAKTTQEVKDLIKTFDLADPSLATMSKAERLAINIYTTDFYRAANNLLRNGAPDASYTDLAAIKELICHTGMAIHGLNAIPDSKNHIVPDIAFRGESYYKEAMEQRTKAAANNGVTMEMGFISTSADKPLDSFDNGVAIVFKGVIGKNVKGVSAYSSENEVLMPPTQIQWSSYSNHNDVHLLQGAPVNTPLNLSNEALTPFDPNKKKIEEAERNFSLDVSLTTSPADMLVHILTAPNLLTDHNHQPIDNVAVFHFMQNTLKDPLKVQAITENEAAHIKELINGGITPQYGLLKKFCEMVQIQHDENLKQKAQNEFKAALMAAGSIEALCSVIETFSKNSHLEMGAPLKVKKMLDEIRGVHSDLGIMRLVGSDPKTANAICSNIIEEFGIRDRFIVMVKDKVQKLDLAIKQISDARTIDELIGVVQNNLDSGVIKLEASSQDQGKIDPQKVVIENMRRFAKNPDIVRGINKAGAAALYFDKSYIIPDYGIQDKFIALVKQIHQKNMQQKAGQKVVDEANSIDELIQGLEQFTKTNTIEDSQGAVDVVKMIHCMRLIRNDLDMLQALKSPNMVEAVFMNTGIPEEALGIRDKFIQLVVNNQLTAKVAQSVSSQSTSISQASISALDNLLVKSGKVIIEEHNALKKAMKGNKGLFHNIKTTNAFTEKGQRRESQMVELSKLFNLIHQSNISPELKARQAYACILQLKETIEAEKQPTVSGLLVLCDEYIKEIKKVVDDKVIASVEQSNWRATAKILSDELKFTAIVEPAKQNKL